MAIQQLSAPALKQMMDDGVRFELVDVRTEAERELARIDGARLLTEAFYAELLAMDRGTVLVCQCHHGIRSQDAAEHFDQQGFRTVFNLSGGIDAWSQLVDPSVPRY
jgi:monothiol glutaredoxin